MKLSGLTIVAPRVPSSRATYAPAKPPPITSVPPTASRRAVIGLGSHHHGPPGVGDRQRPRARGGRRGGRAPARLAGLHGGHGRIGRGHGGGAPWGEGGRR